MPRCSGADAQKLQALLQTFDGIEDFSVSATLYNTNMQVTEGFAVASPLN
jgi:hypothetical protein